MQPEIGRRIQNELESVLLNIQQGGDGQLMSQVLRSVIKEALHQEYVSWGPRQVTEIDFNSIFDQ